MTMIMAAAKDKVIYADRLQAVKTSYTHGIRELFFRNTTKIHITKDNCLAYVIYGDEYPQLLSPAFDIIIDFESGGTKFKDKDIAIDIDLPGLQFTDLYEAIIMSRRHMYLLSQYNWDSKYSIQIISQGYYGSFDKELCPVMEACDLTNDEIFTTLLSATDNHVSLEYDTVHAYQLSRIKKV